MRHEMTFAIAAPPLAYFDSLRCGLVPVRIISGRIEPPWPGFEMVYFVARVTADRFGTDRTRPLYARGQELTGSPNSLVPRHAVRFKKHGSRIMAYRWSDHIPELTDAISQCRAYSNAINGV